MFRTRPPVETSSPLGSAPSTTCGLGVARADADRAIGAVTTLQGISTVQIYTTQFEDPRDSTGGARVHYHRSNLKTGS
jgi:hypothetical protein